MPTGGNGGGSHFAAEANAHALKHGTGARPEHMKGFAEGYSQAQNESQALAHGRAMSIDAGATTPAQGLKGALGYSARQAGEVLKAQAITHAISPLS